MAAITVKFVNRVKFEAKIRQHSITVDLTPDLQGTDAGPMPPELLVLSLASCMGYYALFYCTKNRIPVDGLQIDASFEKAKNPDRVSKIDVKISIPNLPKEHQKGVMEAVDGCIVKQTLMHKPEINISIN
ncbi:MAG TPA: OsmC family protein [bacterium]|nr:OsmC family protein [bacterium]HOL35449.1 OsmC family protein [bacterium]HPP08929.1 OsmC family protein [bacterium]